MKIKILKLDLTKADEYVINAEELIKEKLTEKRLFDKRFLYTCVDGDRKKSLMQTGTYRKGDTIFAFTKDELANADDMTNDIIFHLSRYENPAIAIYKASCFRLIAEYEYEFKNPDKKPESLEAILTFLNFSFA